VLNRNIWGDLIFFSPVVLIAIGIEKIFTRSRLELISYATSVLLVAGGLFLAFRSGSGGRDNDFFSESDGRVQEKGDIKALNASINLDEENLTVQDYSEDVAEWRFKKFSRKPAIDYRSDNGTGVLTVDDRKGGGMWGKIVKVDIDEKSDWYLSFSRDIPLALVCTGDKSDVHLDLSETALRSLKINIDDGRIYVILGRNEPQVDLEATGQDANFRLRVPNDVGLRILGAEDGDYLRTIGLVERGKDFVTEGYDTLPNKVNVKLDDRFRSLTVEFY
jgi:hypothetical protein